MRTVVALGGNAIAPRGGTGTAKEARAHLRIACAQLAALAASGHELIVTHGNGPQVGRLLLQDEALAHNAPRYPLDVHVAETQGQLGYLLQQELAAAFVAAGVARPVVTLVTQVVVDSNDPAFRTPSKPVGPHLNEKGAAEYRARGIEIAPAAGGGWRRVVASPAPCEIVETPVLLALLDAGATPIAAGGGGVAVVREGGHYRGVAAVIDKDLTAAVLVRAVRAGLLLILTDVANVQRDFGTARAEPLRALPVAEARAGVEDGRFAKGSMAEKVLAAASAAESGARAVIASLADAEAAARGDAGTEITP
jgi:carbamate kinase